MSTQSQPVFDWWGLIFNATTEIYIIIAYALTLFIVWFLWTFVFPVDAKTLIKSKIGAGKRKVIVLLTGDEGHSKIFLGEPLPQGVLNIGTKSKPRFIFLPRPFIPEYPTMPSMSDDRGNPLPDDVVKGLMEEYQLSLSVFKDKGMKDITTHVDFQLRRVFWSGLNKPVYFVYSGKAIAVAPQTIALLCLPEKQSNNSWFKVINKIKKPSLESKDDSELLFGTMLDPRVIKTSIPQLYTDAQMRKVHADAVEEGKESMRGGSKNLIVPVLLIMIVIVIGVVIMKIAGVF